MAEWWLGMAILKTQYYLFIYPEGKSPQLKFFDRFIVLSPTVFYLKKTPCIFSRMLTDNLRN